MTSSAGDVRTGAAEIPLSELLDRQKKIFHRVLNAVHLIAATEAEKERTVGKSAYVKLLNTDRPSYVFLIDGPRGSGKTSLTLTLRKYLSALGTGPCDPNVEEQLRKDLTRQPGGNSKKKKRSKNSPNNSACDSAPQTIDFLAPFDLRNEKRRAIHALDVIFPDHMETYESIMEAILARMTIALDDEITMLNAMEGRSSQTNKRLAQAEQLRDELRSKVTRGWYFARRLGVEALLNDSINFDQYIKA